MGLFDKILGNQNFDASLSHEEAFAGVLLSVIAIDGHISDEEIADFSAYSSKAQTLKDIHNNTFDQIIQKLFRILKKEGPAKLAQMSAAAVSPDVRNGLFAMSCDLLFSDGFIEPEEEKLIEDLTYHLHMDEFLAQKIVEVIAIKNRV